MNHALENIGPPSKRKQEAKIVIESYCQQNDVCIHNQRPSLRLAARSEERSGCINGLHVMYGRS